MSRPKKPARLVLLEREGRKTWVIRDGAKFERTGYSEGDVELAQQKLAQYLARSHNPVKPNAAASEVLIADILMAYRDEKYPPETRPTGKDKPPKMREFDAMIGRLNDFWGDMTPDQILGPKCREFTKARGTDSGARRDLAILQAAVNFYKKEYGLKADTVVTLPKKSRSRERWLTRDEAARLIWAVWRDRTIAKKQKRRHLARFILIGLYTGTRHRAILGLQWQANDTGGHIDLANGVMYRRSAAEEESKKRRPAIRIPQRLLAHLERWQRIDKGIPYVVHYHGKPIDRLESSFRAAREGARLDADVVPHCLRHTAVTWQMQAGVPMNEIAGFAGMTMQMLEDVYGHHHPDHQQSIASTRLGGGSKKKAA
ncbi:site-specific integrase [Aureimonas altamirensis]|uniref:site-specific integrase n=1 Tax=Aureimonas altamirensis TaxID=370622 RepID=UPI0020371084|nr:site-specific integrase [Aureimonas altamirensis]MCM2503896.1 site-specific integrase [Aureimonas altamirensis]